MGTAHHSTTQHPVHAHPMQPYAHLQSCAHQQRCMHTSSIACTPAAPHARSQPPSHRAPLCSAVGTCSPAASHAQPHPSLSLYPTTEQGRPIPAVVLFHFSFINLYKKRLHVPQAADIPPPAHPERSHQRGHGDPNPVQGPWPPGWRTGRGGGGWGGRKHPQTTDSAIGADPEPHIGGVWGERSKVPLAAALRGRGAPCGAGSKRCLPTPPALLPPTALGRIPHHVPVLPKLQFGLIGVSHALDFLIQGSNALRRGRKTIRAMTRGGVPSHPPPRPRAVSPPSPNGAASAPPAPASRWGSGIPSALSRRSSGTG